jgi:phosphoglycerol transferase MdoB-like AlkP superfamily enzyme
VGNYLESVHYFDEAFGEFVDALRVSGELDRSVLALYGDHQGWFRDVPNLREFLGFGPGDEFDEWRERKKVPMLIRLPGGALSGERSLPGGHLDTTPTILGLLGVVSSDVVTLGHDLLTERTTPVVFRDGSFVDADGARFLVNAGELDPDTTCYGENPRRLINCAEFAPVRRRALADMHASDVLIHGNLVPEFVRQHVEMSR